MVTTGVLPLTDSPPSGGITYFAGRDLLNVQLRVVRQREIAWQEIQWRGGAPGQPCVAGAPVTRWVRTAWDVSATGAADPTKAFALGLEPSGSLKQTFEAARAETGLLTSLHYNAENQLGDVVANSLKLVAGIAGTVVGLPSARDAVLTPKWLDVPATSGLTPVRVRPTNAYCYAASTDPDGKRHYEAVRALVAELETAHAERAANLRKATAASTPAAHADINAKDALHERRIAALSSRLEAAQSVLTAGADAYARRQRVAATETTDTIAFELDLTELPTTLSAPDYSGLRQRLSSDASRAEVLRMLEQGKVAITVADAQLPPTAAGNPTNGNRIRYVGCDSSAVEPDCARIYFRSPRRRVVTVYVAESEKEDALLIRRSQQSFLLASSADPVEHVAFRTTRFAGASMKLTFGRVGNVASISQTSTAGAAAASAAFANALSGARTEFQASLEAVAKAQSTQLGMQQAARTARLKELTDAQAILEADLALQGAAATQALILQKKQVDAELALLRGQLALDVELANAETSTEVALLRTQVQLLTTQLELLKAQLELGKMRQTP